jgi:hypothetical protein
MKPRMSMDDLRDHLDHLMKRLRDDTDTTLDLDRAKLLIEAGQTVINSAKVEVDFMRVSGQMTDTGFIPVVAQQQALPGGEA